MTCLILAFLVASATALRNDQLHFTALDTENVLAALDDKQSNRTVQWWNPISWFGGTPAGESEGTERFDAGSIKVPDLEKPDMKTELDASFEIMETAGAVDSPYAFGHAWDGLSFEQRWEQFRTAVPLEELQDTWIPDVHTGPVCHPSSDGPADSEKLAIVLHGFTACPGGFYPLTKRMVAAGFRVIRPVLPGHGRKYTKEQTKVCVTSSNSSAEQVSEKCIAHFLKYTCNWAKDAGCEERPQGISKDAHKCCCKENLREFEAGQLPCSGDEITSEYKDDLSQFPQQPGPYIAFAEALGQLVEQFKLEHPSGQVVVVGHSLGGVLAAKFALERPRIVDRLLLMNPMFGLSNNLVTPLLKLGGNIRVSWKDFGTPECDARRDQQGGYCQFNLANVGAMSDLAYLVLCRHWGFTDHCKLGGARALGLVAGLGGTAGMAAGVGTGAAAAAAAAGSVTISHAVGWTTMIQMAALSGHIGTATAIAASESAFVAAGVTKATIGASIGASMAAAAKTGALAGGAAGLAAGPAAPAAVPAGALVGGVIASLAVGIAAYLVISAAFEKAARKAAELMVANMTKAAEIRENFGYLKQIQVLTTDEDPAIDNSVFGNLYKELFNSRFRQIWQQDRRPAVVERQASQSVGLAYWPKEVNHGYNNNQFHHDQPFQPYIENAVAAFCTEGIQVPVVDRRKGEFAAVTAREQVSADGMLTVIPLQSFFKQMSNPGYMIGDGPGGRPFWVSTMFDGRVQNKCEYGMFTKRWDHIEVVSGNIRNDETELLILERQLNGPIYSLKLLQSPVRTETECDKRCIVGQGAVLDPSLPLWPQW
eukprot:CAMPEP_0197626616 /NCGR_PEP_ID=MMETSP1338-20131121/5496_1 /TAXON_ID=43686 ORGANISM="Pelagodinium beii, Strain RCC1491" /NCGR_SAMPLE_ID=MMETSP1338 /ASSEMBLY_ACC=CAM_ASM_000754 /LENGTH=821 /DNA_ID=CAMNT_0043197161 /DNA_START=65 /DNA_END=2527 /DNA_ORIENTATION=+